ncbi:MAG: type I glyceraldehyde-3-phosphate dehydrogenase [Methylocystaceae bacterium]
MATKVAVNGFGRIGRLVSRIILERKDLELVAINDLGDLKTSAHLFKYDSVHGRWPGQVEINDQSLVIDGREIAYYSDSKPENLPWGQIGADIIIESTGKFTERAKAEAHLKAGGRKVIITAPGKEVDATFVMGVNEHIYNPDTMQIVSNASCTTNCLAPVTKVLNDQFGIVRGMMTTVHSYTNDQRILDLPHKDLRRARAAGMSMIPTTTGAAKAIGLVIPELKGKLNGTSVRVPTPNVSMVDLVAELKKPSTVEDINQALKSAAAGSLKGILEYCDEPLVSSDFNGDPHSSIVDALSTMVIDGNLVKIIAWYDNEWGYSNRVVDLAAFMGQKR